jgi:hypothetical protein
LDDVTVYSGGTTPGNFTYNIYRDGAKVNTAPVTTESYTDQGFVTTAGHAWEVKAICNSDESDPSNEVDKPACYTPGSTDCDDYLIAPTVTANYYVPINTYFGDNYTQMIYDAADIGTGAGTINSLQLNTLRVLTRNDVTIYLANTSKSIFSGTSDWVPFAELTEVYHGAVNLVANGWIELEFNAPFTYTGDNLLVVFLNNQLNTGDGTASSFNVHTTTTDKCLNYYKDNAPGIDPTNPPAATGVYGLPKTRANIKFNICTGSGPGGPCVPTDVTIGNVLGNNGTPGSSSVYQPVLRYYVHSYGQYIYDPADLGGAGAISSLAFYDSDAGAFNANNITVWLGNTAKTEFANPVTSEFVPLGQMQQVFHGAVTGTTGAGWLTITFDDDFDYTGGNLVVAIHNSQSPYTGSGTNFYNTPTTLHKSIQTYSDSSPIDPANPVMYGAGYIHYLYSPDIKFNICVGGGGACDPVTDVVAQYVNGCDVQLTWTPPGKKAGSGAIVPNSGIPSLQISAEEAAKEALENGSRIMTVRSEQPQTMAQSMTTAAPRNGNSTSKGRSQAKIPASDGRVPNTVA